MQINYILPASMVIPEWLELSLAQAAAILESNFPGSGTLNVAVSYGGVPVGALSVGGPAGPSGALWTYAQVKSQLDALDALASSPHDSMAAKTFAASLPAISPFGDQLFYIPSGLLKQWGLLNPSNSAPDVSIDMSSIQPFTPNGPTMGDVAGQYDATGDIVAEITHGMGRFPGLGVTGSNASILDLMRYSAPGIITQNPNDPHNYFSLDGGKTSLGLTASGDISDFSMTSDVDGIGATNSVMNLSSTDLKIMNALGWQINDPENPMGSITSTNQVLTGNDGNHIALAPDNLGVPQMLAFSNCANETVTAQGSGQQTIMLAGGDSRMTIIDNNPNLKIFVEGANQGITLEDFLPTATLDLIGQGFPNSRQALADIIHIHAGYSLALPDGASLFFADSHRPALSQLAVS